MTNETTQKGIWWRPEKPDQQLDGEITFSPATGARLELSGHFFPGGVSAESFTVQGVTLQGKSVTLFNCMVGMMSMHIPGMRVSEISSFLGVVGGHFQAKEELHFAKVYVDMTFLHCWTYRSGIVTRILEEGKTHLTQFEILPPIELGKAAGFALKLEFVRDGSASFGESRISENCILTIEADDSEEIEPFLKVSQWFQQFLALGVGRPVYIRSVEARMEQPRRMVEDKPIYDQYQLILKYSQGENYPENLIPRNMLYCLDDLFPEPAEFVCRYFEKQNQLEPVCNLYFLSLYYPEMVLPQRLLVLANAVEAYHRAFIGGKYQSNEEYHAGLQRIFEGALPSNIDQDFRSSLKNKLKYLHEYSLRKRLQDLCRQFEPVLGQLLGDSRRFAEEVSGLRNRFTHPEATIEEQLPEPDWKDLFLKGEQLGLLLEVCLLHEVGFSDERIAELLPRNRRIMAIRLNR